MRVLTIAALVASLAGSVAAETITAAQRDFMRDVAAAHALSEICSRAKVNYLAVSTGMIGVGLAPDALKRGNPVADLMTAEIRRANTRLSDRSAADACADAVADFGPLGERQPGLMAIN